MIGYAGTFAIPGGRGRATLRCVQSIERIDAQLGRRLGINSAWRDPIEQERLYTAYRSYVNGNGPWAPIALPPEQSVHCKGEAIDTDDNNAAMTRILNNNGWFHTVFRNGQLVEPWHYEYNQSKDKFFGSTPANSGGATPFPEPPPIPKESEPQMRVVKYGPDIYTFGAQYVKHETNWDQAAFMAGVLNADKNFIEVPTQKAFDALCESFGVPASVLNVIKSGRGYDLSGNAGTGRIWSKANDTGQQVDNVLNAVRALPKA